MSGRGLSDRALVWGMASTQLIGWGTLFTPFPLMVAPMEAELGWSRVLINAAYTCGLLASGLAAAPAGRWFDRHGPHGMMTAGTIAAAALLVAWSLVAHPVVFFAIWIGIGVAQAIGLWGIAMAVVVAEARDATRTITIISFVTGLTGTVFLPFSEWLIHALGWRGALQALAALQGASAVITVLMLRHARRPAPGLAAAATRIPLRTRLRQPAFAGLALCFAAHAFIATGLGAHLIPLLRERGWPEATVLLLAAAHGPAQVVARGLLFAAGRAATMRSVGLLASGLVPVGMLALAVAPSSLALTIAFVLCWAVADGLMTIVRAAGTAEILGREGYGAVTGALSAIAMLPRTAAPLLLALLWDGLGGYAAVPWLLTAVGGLALLGFAMAARPR
ncbi:MFS transporter [Roseomonas fluvialis]|uniref:Transporter, MFS family protein n=1 Tax=Roseomonas fluvialis TaxID=1750527 RepID=A0ABN6PAS7_9PROT|nr:MFS transporter [Roseomonas fluvialis]BDG74615.1 putative transporter, MFS family protein [Roseomonas fluvialis]